MIEEYVSKGKMVTLAVWGVVVLLMVFGWVMILAAPDHWRIGGMFAATACATSALAATLHIRCYAVRLACLMRVTAKLPIDDAFDGPRPIR